jgi:hypothetical protein
LQAVNVITFLLQRYVPYFEECRNPEGLCLVSNVQQLQEDSRISRIKELSIYFLPPKAVSSHGKKTSIESVSIQS